MRILPTLITAFCLVIATGNANAQGPREGSHHEGSHHQVKQTPQQKPSAKSKSQTHCPVSDELIDKAIYVDHAGKRVYFCCKKCRGKFNAGAEEFMNKINAQGVVLEEARAEQDASVESSDGKEIKEKKEKASEDHGNPDGKGHGFRHHGHNHE